MGKVLGYSLKSCADLCPCPIQCPGTRWSPSTVPNYWYGHLQNVVFTVVPVRHRTRVQCPGTKCERRLTEQIGGLCTTENCVCL